MAPQAALIGLLAVASLALALAVRQPPLAQGPPATSAGTPPPAFVANAGQTDPSVAYMARGPGVAIYLTPQKVVLDFQRDRRGVALELGFRGANPNPVIMPERRVAGRVSYIGRSERHTNLSRYSQVRYRDLWPGIDMVLRAQPGTLKYEFVVHPGADPTDVRLAYAGADSLAVSRGGALKIGTPLGTLRDAAPRSFQGERRIATRYDRSGMGYGFALGKYDDTRTLVIDPSIVYSTYLGGSLDEYPRGLDVDPAGNAYVTGFTSSNNYPTTPGAYDTTSLTQDTFVTKLGPSGALVYSTYLGGDVHGDFTSASDQALDIAIDSSGHAYVFGNTDSSDFPTTPGAYRTTIPNDQQLAFVTKLNSTGTGLDYSTFVGPAIASWGALDVGADGSAYITGTRNGTWPTTPGAYDPNGNGPGNLFVTKLTPSGAALAYSTVIGGGGSGERGLGIFVESDGEAYITGDTGSIDFSQGLYPTTPGAYDTTMGSAGHPDVIVTKLNATGSALVYSTYIGEASDDTGDDIVVDDTGSAYVSGYAGSNNFPTTPGAYATTYVGSAFVTKLNPAGSALSYSTFLPGYDGHGIALDSAKNAYVTGQILDNSLPATPDAFDTSYNGGADAYLSVLNPTGSALNYATYLGGSEFDAGADVGVDGQNATVTGETRSSNYPLTPGAVDTSQAMREAFVTRLSTAPFTGYARPKGATPSTFSLVTAYEQCTDPNEIHGPPLAFGSCAAPQMASDYLTVGTADSNGLPARNEGHVRLDSILGNPATPADEADVRIELYSDDVFTKALADYSGELRAQFTVRITDRDNAPTGGGPAGPGTTADVPLGATFGCVGVADPQEGSVCALSTTIDAITPGAVTEGKRTIWQLDRVRVFDGGSDGDGDTVGNNTLFATAGVFVP